MEKGKKKKSGWRMGGTFCLIFILCLGGCQAQKNLSGEETKESAKESAEGTGTEEREARLASDGSMIFGEPVMSLEPDQLFDIDGAVATKKEYMVFFLNTRNQYKDEFGESILEKNTGSTNFEDELRENVLNNLAQMKAMVRIAQYESVSLEEKELLGTQAAAHAYYESLSGEAKNFLSVTEEEIETLYEEYALANKLYYQMTSDADTEVSDDEARVAVIQQILIKTVKMTDGTETEMTEDEKKEAFEQAKEAWRKARDGADFTVLAESFNDSDTPTDVTFSRNTMPKEVEDAVFDMENDSISDVLKTEKGYYIIKCIDSYDKELTDENKKTIIEKRQEEAFWNLYRKFMDEAPSVFNDAAWEAVKQEQVNGIETKDFFELYDEFVMGT